MVFNDLIDQSTLLENNTWKVSFYFDTRWTIVCLAHGHHSSQVFGEKGFSFQK